MNQNLLGGLAIFVSNIGIVLITILIKTGASSFFEGLLILAIGNFFASFISLIKLIFKREHNNILKIRNLNVVAIWALLVTFNYFLFNLVSKIGFSVSNFILAEAIAPIVTALIWAFIGKIKFKMSDFLFSIISMGFLFFLIYLECDSSVWSTDRLFWFLTLLMILLFSGSQIAAQKVSIDKNEWLGSAEMTFLSGILFMGLVFIFLLFKNKYALVLNSRVIFVGLALGLLVVLVQFSYLLGLRNCAPLFSALMISTGIPISMLFTLYEKGFDQIFLRNFLLSLLYCFWIFGFKSITWKFSKK